DYALDEIVHAIREHLERETRQFPALQLSNQPIWERAYLVDGNQLCEIGPHLLTTLGRLALEVQRVVRRWHLALEVQYIMPKAIHMGGEVRAQTGQDVLVHGIALLD